MRDKWYADNRDLVKWGVLLTLAERYESKHILQVLYYRSTDWANLEVDETLVPIPPAVIRHFRHSTSVSDIETRVGIEVLAEAFVDRDRYHSGVLNRIRTRSVAPGIVFLDPDTGLQSRTPSLDHVLDRELAEIWAAMYAKDLLVFYQHQTNRNAQPWLMPKKEQFERAIGLAVGAAKVARSDRIARDVAFFFAQKPA